MKRSRLMYTILVTVLLCSCGRNTSSELQQDVKQDEVQESNDFNQSIDEENDVQESNLSDDASCTADTDTKSESTNETIENKTASMTSNSANSSKKNNQGSSDTTSTKKTDSGQNTSSGSGNNTSSASNTTNKNNSSSSSSNTTNSNTSSSTQHKHNWTAVYETVYHEAVCDTVWVIDKKAYTEEVTVYEWQSYPICSACGEDISGNVYEHTKAHALKGENAGHREGWRQVAVGTETITHAEEGHYEYKEIKAAYTEKKLVGYKCSCGTTK